MVALASLPDHGLAFMPARETLTHIEYRGIPCLKSRLKK